MLSISFLEGSADSEQTGFALIASARRFGAAMFGPAAQLFVADHRQYWPQPFLVGDGALVDLVAGGKVKNLNQKLLALRSNALICSGFP